MFIIKEKEQKKGAYENIPVLFCDAETVLVPSCTLEAKCVENR